MGDVADFIITAENISKIYPGTKALDSVNYRVYRGKVNVIIGENGAGKSTLMKILAGVEKATTGKVFLNGEEIILESTRDALKHGIGMVHQELSLFDNLTVAQNLFLGRESEAALQPIDSDHQFNVTEGVLKRLKQTISPDERVANLKVGQQQLVEIGKALAEQADVLILDEPTSALSNTEVDILFDVIHELTEQGVTIIYISHRLEELMTIGDYITILRDGHFQAESAIEAISLEWIVKEMLGSDPVTSFLNTERRFGKPVLEVDDLCVFDSMGHAVVKNLSLSLKAGEIVGIYGLMGAGRTELFEALLGQRSSIGHVCLDEHPLTQRTSTSERIRHGITLVPEDRKSSGVFPISAVAHNLTISSLWRRLKHHLAINKKSEADVVEKTIHDLSIKVSSPDVEIQALSGGNQQKVVLGRSLLTDPQVLLLDEPTRGIDVGAKVDVFKMMVQLSEQGIGILFSTSDLKEIMSVSDRILVMANGKLTANVARKETTEAELVLASA